VPPCASAARSTQISRRLSKRVYWGSAVPKRFDSIALLVALAALIVSAAKAAWDVYWDLKSEGKKAPAREVVERRLRIELQPEANVSIEQRDRIITVLVDEVARAAADT
jgi:hypothetical protein